MMRTILLLAAILATSCSMIPERNAALEQAWSEFNAASADPHVASLARHELDTARETLDRASRANSTLQDPAWVDHLAYVARQQVALSVHMAAWRSTPPAEGARE